MDSNTIFNVFVDFKKTKCNYSVIYDYINLLNYINTLIYKFKEKCTCLLYFKLYIRVSKFFI